MPQPVAGDEGRADIVSWVTVLEAVREVERRRPADAEVRVWDPGCGDGLNTYLLAGAFAEVDGERGLLGRVHVFGTDDTPASLEAARTGRYELGTARRLPDDVSERYFERVHGQLSFREELRSAVSFGRNHVEHDRPISRVDLLDGRGLLAGRDGAARQRILERFADALRPDGVLLLDRGEEVGAGLGLRAIDRDHGLWEKLGARDEVLTAGTAWRPSRPVRIVVVNEQDLFVRGIGMLLESLFGRFIEVVATADDPQRAWKAVERQEPDLVLVDVSEPTGAGFARRLRHDQPEVQILALADEPSEAWRELVAGGLDGVLPRSISPEELIGPLLCVAEGLKVLPPEAVRALSARVAPEHVDLLDELDRDELQLWAWIAEGKQDNQIAEELYVSPRTVKRRTGALLRRLGVGRRVEAAELAGRLGVLAKVASDGE